MNKVIEIVSLNQTIREKHDFPIKKISSSFQIAQFLQDEIGQRTQQTFVMVCLNQKNEVTHYSEVSTGTVNKLICSTRDLLQRALLANTSCIITSYNRPSQNINNNSDDNLLVHKIKDACHLLDIEFIDHIIVSGNNYLSYREESLI